MFWFFLQRVSHNPIEVCGWFVKMIKHLNMTVFLSVHIISVPLKMHFSEQNLSTDCLCHHYDNSSRLNSSYSASPGQLYFSHSHIQFLFVFSSLVMNFSSAAWWDISCVSLIKLRTQSLGVGFFSVCFMITVAFKYQDRFELYGRLEGFITQNLLLNSLHRRGNPLSWCCYYITSLKN